MCLHATPTLDVGGFSLVCNREGDAAARGRLTSTGHRIWTPVPGRRFCVLSSGTGQRGCWPVRHDRGCCESRAPRPTRLVHPSFITPDEASV